MTDLRITKNSVGGEAVLVNQGHDDLFDEAINPDDLRDSDLVIEIDMVERDV